MDTIEILGAPPITGLAFRHYQGEQDLPAMLDVLQSSCMTDQDDEDDVHESLEDLTNQYRNLIHCDPYQDVLIAEVSGQMVAYGRVTWWKVEASGERIYFLSWYIRLEWSGQGLEKIFLNHSQERVRQIIRQQAGETTAGVSPDSGARLFEAHAASLQPETARLLEEDGFQAIRWGSMMTCPDLQNIPGVPMPEGLEVRPARPEHYRQVWDAMLEAFSDHWGYAQPSEEDYIRWQQNSHFQPDLWQVAWEGEHVAGMVLNYISYDPGAAESSRAWTEDICVRRPWRRRGLARALVVRRLRLFRELGYTETSLGVDLDNLHGARQLYESMGYQLVSVLSIYRKPVDL